MGDVLAIILAIVGVVGWHALGVFIFGWTHWFWFNAIYAVTDMIGSFFSALSE